MTISRDGHAPPKRRPGPKPRGRTVVPLTITVTHAQRATLEARADTEQVSISTIVRRFIAAGLAAGGLIILSALIEIASARRTGAGALWGSKGEHTMTDSRMVHGHMLAALGMVAGRTIYSFTSHGEVYRLTPDLPTTYLLRRPADGYAGVFGTLEEAVAYVDTLEQGEQGPANRTRIAGRIAR